MPSKSKTWWRFCKRCAIDAMPDLTRRESVLLAAHASLAWGVALALPAAHATTEAQSAAMLAFTGGQTPREGRVVLDIAPLVENGNTVPMTVSVQSPMTLANHVQSIAVFNERNPQPEVIVFHLGPRAGRADVAARIRLATSQRVVAIARMNDGNHWMHAVDVIVTLAACIED
jgi:sulfur-oxidizing protein SoxY